MEDSETKPCPNCKREIPAINFEIHSVHCARNIRVCPVCKEPVPHSELQEHHDKLHKLLPCEKCGESVCGTDMEDHIRDSCAHTIKSCRYCELELPRRSLPAHENYCGVRTEQCPDCREYVMIKYRQLHLDSNHGFLRLDDDPTPVPKKEPLKTSTPKSVITKMTNIPSTSNVTKPKSPEIRRNGYTNNTPFPISAKNINQQVTNEVNRFDKPSTSASCTVGNEAGPSRDWRSSCHMNGVRNPVKRTNDQPQINVNVTAANKVDKVLPVSRGAVKKRPAPQPPAEPPTADPRRDHAYHSALARQQREEKARQEQTAYNLSVGLPPVLSAAEKLDKLRKMDAVQNPNCEVDYKSRLQGRVWKTPEHEIGHPGYVLGSEENSRQRHDFRNLKPMSPQEFMDRFNELQLRSEDNGEIKKTADRFSEIKSSLRELRKGLNEVTAPYNSNSSNNNGDRANFPPPQDEDRLPCEFCGTLIPAGDLVQHQTGCRPDLAQLRPRSISPLGRSPPGRSAPGRSAPGRSAPSRSPPRARPVSRPSSPYDCEPPVIPCEFCAESLPVYLITEHQERCGREANLIYFD